MLESVLDRGLAAGGMLPHVAAQLPTLVSGLVTALERTPDAAATAALADDPAPLCSTPAPAARRQRQPGLAAGQPGAQRQLGARWRRRAAGARPAQGADTAHQQADKGCEQPPCCCLSFRRSASLKICARTLP